MTEREKIAHLLRRFCLGASEGELDYFVPLGLDGTVRFLLETWDKGDNWDLDPMEMANAKGVVNIRVAQGLYYLRLLSTNRPFLEKMTLFWHNHFATSAAKVLNSFVMMNHIETLRENALGNFRTLLKEISKDPAMLYWLDNNLNVKGHPNENFAREVMELFTLGIGNYTERDIQEAARAFTGWGFGIGRAAGSESGPRRRETFRFSARDHDDGVKTVLGKSANFGGDAMLDHLCDQPRVAEFIAHKAWVFFGTENPSASAVQASARAFRDSGLEISALIRSIMTSAEFYSESVVRTQIKNPVDFTISSARQVGAGQMILDRIQRARTNPQKNPQNGLNTAMARAAAPGFAALQATTTMGMELMKPPDVSGWGSGEKWISTATLTARWHWADLIFPGGPTTKSNIGGDLGGTRGPSIAVPAWPIFSSDPSPEGVAKRMVQLFDAPLPNESMVSLTETIERLSGGRLTPANANEVCRTALRSVCAAPGFQFN